MFCKHCVIFRERHMRYALVLPLWALISAGVIEASPAEHLVPVNLEANANYRQLYEKKLFVTSGDVARFVFLPAALEPEFVVSVYRRKKNQVTGESYYNLTVTMPSKRLWNCIPTGDEKFTGRRVDDPKTVRTLRWDASLPDSTALAIHSLWLESLRRAAPDPCTGCVLIDSSDAIFSVVTGDGRTLQARLPKSRGKATESLLNVGFRLAEYSRAPASLQSGLAKKLQKTATELVMRISRE